MNVVPVLAAGLVVASCGLLGDKELNAEAETIFADLGAGRIDSVMPRLSSTVNPVEARNVLTSISTMIGPGAPPAANVTGVAKNASTSGSTYQVIQAYAYPAHRLIMTTTFLHEAGDWKVVALNLERDPPLQPGQLPQAAPTGAPAA